MLGPASCAVHTKLLAIRQHYNMSRAIDLHPPAVQQLLFSAERAAEGIAKAVAAVAVGRQPAARYPALT